MFDAFKASGGDIRLWIYQGLKHDCWTRAYDEQELPHWLLAHHNPAHAACAFAERIVIPLAPAHHQAHTAQLDSLAGEYREPNGHAIGTIFRQGDQLFEKSPTGDIVGLEAESADTFFRPVDPTGAHNVQSDL